MHFWNYDVVTTNQSAESAIADARRKLHDNEEARRLNGQKPLTLDDYAACDAIDARVRAAANANGNVTCNIKLFADDITTPPVEIEEGEGEG